MNLIIAIAAFIAGVIATKLFMALKSKKVSDNQGRGGVVPKAETNQQDPHQTT